MEPAAHVARAPALLAVADGAAYTDAAHAAGRRSGDAVAHLVARSPIRVLGFAGSLRAGSYNRALRHAAVQLVPDGR